ncbi:MAG: alpha/beta hydrolase [Pseudomonadota bacterium]
MRHTLLDTPGGKIAYCHREGITPGVLFLPGFNSNMQGTKALALDKWCADQGVQFTRFDYAGHGFSSGRFEDGTIGQWLSNAESIIEQVCVGPHVLVGSSMGGWIMLLLALRQQQRLTGLLGIASAPDFTETLAHERLDTGQLESLDRRGFCELANEYDGGEPYRIGRALLEEGRQHRLLHTEIAIDLPVRLIHGQRDEDVPWELSLRIAERLRSRDVEIQLVKSGDHRLCEPEDIARMLAALSELRRLACPKS